MFRVLEGLLKSTEFVSDKVPHALMSDQQACCLHCLCLQLSVTVGCHALLPSGQLEDLLSPDGQPPAGVSGPVAVALRAPSEAMRVCSRVEARAMKLEDRHVVFSVQTRVGSSAGSQPATIGMAQFCALGQMHASDASGDVFAKVSASSRVALLSGVATANHNRQDAASVARLLSELCKASAHLSYRASKLTQLLKVRATGSSAGTICFLRMATYKSVPEKGLAQPQAWHAGDVSASPEQGRGMRASRSDTRAASQAFERMHIHVSMWRKHAVLAVRFNFGCSRCV